MGRPALKRDDVTVKTTIRLPRSLLDRVAELAGERPIADFIRQAVEEKLKREERP